MKNKAVGLMTLLSVLLVGLMTIGQQARAEGANPSQWDLLCYFHGEFIGMANSIRGCVGFLTLNQIDEIRKTHSNPMDCIVSVPFRIWNFN